MPDRGMIVKWFEFCRVEDKCSVDCPYWDNKDGARECTIRLAKDVLTLLKEQEKDRLEIAHEMVSGSILMYKCKELVRCKDCKYWSAERINDFNKCRRWINVGVKNFATMGDWFCADGEKK